MGAGSKVLMVLRVFALIAAMVVVGLGVWSKFILHEVDVRGASVLQRLQPEALTAQHWRDFFTAANNGSIRIWISLVSASVAALTTLLVILSNTTRRLEMSEAIRIPIEFLSMCAMTTAFGCTLSFALSLISFSRMRLETADSADLTMFSMILPIGRGLVVTTGTGSFILLTTTISAIVQACMRARAKESCSFEPTASSLGMDYGYQAIVPPVESSRPPTMYDPRKPLPKQLDGMPQTEEEKDLAVEVPVMKRVDSMRSATSIYSDDMEKQETWPLNPETSAKVLQIRPSRPWSSMPKQDKSLGAHAL